jgi:uncharacterized membrane protein HdeD (DUF308 family)
MAQVAPASMCPMAETCKGMMERPLSGLMMVVPGLVFMVLGVLIVVWPSVLPWLVAAGCIVAGTAMLMMANFMRGIGARLRNAGH